MLSDLSSIGTVSFQHRRYGTDGQVEWIVESSTDQGGVWTEVGRFTAGATVATFAATLDRASATRLRIRNAVTAGNNSRVNIDDIIITSYVAPALPLPVITSPLLGNGRVGEDFAYQLTAANSPDLLEVEDLPAGLAVDPGVPGRITGRPSEGGAFLVTLRAVNAAGETTATLRLDIESSSYAGWSGDLGGGQVPSSPDLLAAYAVGGAASPQSPSEAPVVAIEAGYLIVSAVIRTDDPDLVVTGVVVSDLADFGGPAQIIIAGERAADQSGVPAGHEHQLFRVLIGSGDSKKFLRLEAVLQP